MKKNLTNDRRKLTNGIAKEAEDAANLGQMKGVYDAIRRLAMITQ